MVGLPVARIRDMLLDLTRYRQPQSRFERTFQPDEVASSGDAYRIVAPVVLAFDLFKDKERFRLSGTVATELELPCSRCLEPFRLPVHAAFDQRFLPAAELDAAEDERETQDEDVEIGYYRDDQIDLNELMREQFYLALPMKPLCRDDCKGLCPQCGTNLNTATCSCDVHWEDPRLAPLKGLVRPS
jgi:uncharacterized protein